MGLFLSLALAPASSHAQALDLSHGGPVTVTALGGIDWNQNEQTVTAHDDARAVRGGVTVTADRLIAHYRKKAGTPGAPGTPGASKTDAAQLTVQPAVAQPAVAQPAATKPGDPATPGVTGAPSDTGNNEIYRLEADGHVHIYTQTDQAWGDHAVYDIDQAVLVLTGKKLKLTTPQDVLTSRDAMEYWSQKHLAIGRGDATATSNDGRRIVGDTLVAYTVDNAAPHPPGTPAPPAAKPDKDAGKDPGKAADPLQSSGKIQRVEAYGHVQVRTSTEIVNGDRGVYVPDTGMARVVGHVHITRGESQLNGASAIVNMKTGVATLVQTPGTRVQGLVVPNEQQPKTAPSGKVGPSGKTAPVKAAHKSASVSAKKTSAASGTTPETQK